jgi:hypothetical protein
VATPRRAAVVAAALALLVLFAARQAFAQPAPTDAEQLFEQARELMAEGRFAEACAKLESSEAEDPGIGTEFNLARCYDLGGRFASARAMYRRVIQETHVAGEKEREAVARELDARLEPRVAHLVLHVVSPVAALELRVDDVPVPPSEWGALREIDSGAHAIEASAPAFLPWKTTIQITKDAEILPLDVPPLTPRAAIEPVAPLAPPITPLVPGSAAETSPKSSSQRIVAVALGALGLAGLVPGTYFGLQAISLESQASSHCLSAGCDPTGFSLRTSSRWNGDASTVTFVLSGALLAAAGIVWLTAPHGR